MKSFFKILDISALKLRGRFKLFCSSCANLFISVYCYKVNAATARSCKVRFYPKADLGLFSMFGPTGAPQKGAHTSQKMSDNSVTFSDLWGLVHMA